MKNNNNKIPKTKIYHCKQKIKRGKLSFHLICKFFLNPIKLCKKGATFSTPIQQYTAC